LITQPIDILEVTYDRDLVGIFPIETLDWKIEDEKNMTLLLTKGMKYSEEHLVIWLTDHGFKAMKSDEQHTFFRQGDTVSVETRKGTLLINFFGSLLETLYLDGVEQNESRFFAV
jgi:excinuclease UvrABC helicase subunit UvrB